MENLQSSDFSYLDLFEEKLAQQRELQEKYFKKQAQEQQEIEENKPAFFRDERKATASWREQEAEGHRKLQE